MVLVVARDDAAAVDDGCGVGGSVLGGAELVGDVLRAIEVPDDDDEIAETLVVEAPGELGHRLLRCCDEGRPVRHVLDRVAREHHLRQHHEVRIALGGLPARRQHELGIALQVAHAGVDLGESEAQLGHAASVSAGTCWKHFRNIRRARLRPWVSRKTSSFVRSRNATFASSGCGSPTCSAR
jgi:hypothetical protein